MLATFRHRALDTHVRVLPDGRSVVLRRAVPSDEPRLSIAFGASRDIGCGHDSVAFDEHGTIVGHAASATDVAVAPGWAGCGLEDLLAVRG